MNDWHYHGIPHDYNKPYLCKVEHPTNREMTDLEILFYDEKDMSWFRWLTLWSGEEGNETVRINRKVIAWKEIVLPQIESKNRNIKFNIPHSKADQELNLHNNLTDLGIM